MAVTDFKITPSEINQPKKGYNMFKSLMLTLAAIPMISFADVSQGYTPQEIDFIEDALDNLVTPARVDRVEVGVGIGDDDDDYRPGRTRYVCYARNARGQVFDAVGYSPSRVQRRAVNNCENYSRFCRAAGCRSYR